MHESVILNTSVYITYYRLPSNLRPATRECVHMVSVTDMTRKISRPHAYMPPLECAVCLGSCIRALTKA